MKRTKHDQLILKRSLNSRTNSIRFTGLFAALVLVSPLFAVEPATPVAVKGDVQIKKPLSDFVRLDPTAPIPSGSELKTGVPGEVTLDFAQGARGVLEKNSGLLFGGARDAAVREVQAGFTDRGSAVKSILTHNDTEPTRLQYTPPRSSLWLREGSLISAVQKSQQRIDLPVALILATDSGFVSTVESPTSVRISVGKGFVTVGLPDGRTIPVTSGQYARIQKIKTGIGYLLTGPVSAEKDDLAQADIARFVASSAKLAEPVGELSSQAVARSAGGVGTGISAPFDIGRNNNERESRLTSPAAALNVLAPTISTK